MSYLVCSFAFGELEEIYFFLSGEKSNNQIPNALFRSLICESHKYIESSFSSASAKSVIIRASSLVSSSRFIRNSKKFDSSFSIPIHSNLTILFSFMAESLAFDSELFQKNVKRSPSTFTWSANHSPNPSGVLSREKSTFGEQLRLYSNSNFDLIIWTCSDSSTFSAI